MKVQSTARRWLGGLLGLLACLDGARAAASPRSDASTELLRRDCSSDLGRNEVTLFANGTVRWREWRDEDVAMRLAEIGRDEVAGLLRRLAECHPETIRESPGGVSGAWMERCEIAVALPESPPKVLRYGRLDTHSLAMADLLRIAEELAERAQQAPLASSLPADYTPRFGDLLLRVDEVEFEVVGRTADGKGIELRGKVQPLSMYLSLDEVRRQFVKVMRRGGAR